MDMTPIQWVLIVLLVLLIAVGVFMLTRKPASNQDRNEEDGQISTNYAAGGKHVAAGDAGATSSAPLYDQEADTAGVESSVEEEPIEAPVWQGDDSLGQDTATGGDIDIVEEEPVISADEDVEPIHAPADPTDHGDREQMAYGTPQAEDFASETVYAEAPIEDYAVDAPVDSTDDADTSDLGASDSDNDHVDGADVPDTVVVDDHDDVPRDAAAAGFLGTTGATGATAMGSQQASDDEATDDDADAVTTDVEGDQHESHTDHAHDDLATENPGPQAEDEGWTEGHPDQGHPGGESQPRDEATYAAPAISSEGSENPGPEEGEGGADDEAADLGHPGPDSQRGDEASYAVGAAGAGATASDEVTGDEGPDAQTDEVVVDEVVVEEIVIVDEPVAVEEVVIDEPAADEHVAGEAFAQQPVEDEPVSAEAGDGADTEEETHAPVAAEEDHTTEDVEPTDEHESADDDQPQVAMVDVNDYGTHESVQPDHDTDQPDTDHHEGEQPDTDHHEGEQPDTDHHEGEQPDTDEHGTEEHHAEETTYAPVVAEDQQLDTSDEHSVGQPVEGPADEPNPLIEASPYGVGSAIPGDDGQGPSGYEIKGNAGSMLFHTPESPSYDECTPEVFFENEDAARAAGFAHWDRKRR